MSKKKKIEMAVDLVMIVLLPVLMAYSLVGETVHEWVGIAMFLLFVVHHILNYRWLKNIVRGKYNGARVLTLAVNLLLVIVMVGLPVSGALMARHTLTFFNISSAVSGARVVHLVLSYWGFVLMSFHLGMHWNMVMSMLRKAAKIKDPSRVRAWLLRVAAALISGYGVYAFVTRQFPVYMFLESQFVFFDYGEPLILFFAEYLMIMGLFVCFGHYVFRGVCRISKREQNK